MKRNQVLNVDMERHGETKLSICSFLSFLCMPFFCRENRLEADLSGIWTKMNKALTMEAYGSLGDQLSPSDGKQEHSIHTSSFNSKEQRRPFKRRIDTWMIIDGCKMMRSVIRVSSEPCLKTYRNTWKQFCTARFYCALGCSNIIACLNSVKFS